MIRPHLLEGMKSRPFAYADIYRHPPMSGPDLPPALAALRKNESGSVVQLPDGRWFATWSQGSFESALDERIVGAVSEDLGRTWSEPRTITASTVEFRRAYQGKLWIEVMLLRDVNDDDAALQALAALLARAAPDQVHLTLPDRPPTEPWIEPPDADGLMRATAILGSILGDAAQVVPPSGVRFDFAEGSDPEAELLAIFTRHPMSEAQVTQALAGDESTIAALEALARSGKARLTTRLGVRFWTTAEQRFEPASVVQQQNGAQLQQS